MLTNCDGDPVKATQYTIGSDGKTTASKTMMPTAAGGWIDAPKGAKVAPIENTEGHSFYYETTTLAGTTNAGMFTATEVNKTKTGEVQYIKIAHIAAPGSTQTDLVSMQTDGATRVDVDGDGYREVTEWITPSDAMLGIDLDGDGVIGNSRELFNGAATAFDQRGWGSLQYYDSNKDNKIDRSDAVFKLLRPHAANDIHFWRAA